MAKILIVEDNQGTNKAICEYMKEAGHTLFSAFTGSEALKIFREKELDIIHVENISDFYTLLRRYIGIVFILLFQRHNHSDFIALKIC